jgi:hypothetical protein
MPMKRSCSFKVCVRVVCLIGTLLLAWQSGWSAGGKQDPADELFALENFLEVKIQMNPLYWDRLRYQYRDITKERKPGEAFKDNYTYLPATVFINGESIGSVGLRKKGLIGSSSTQRPSLKIKFNHSKKGGRYLGLDRLTLNNNIQDSSLVKQYLSYKLFRKAGLPAPRCNFARVYVNGQYLGVYSNVESIRKPFLKRVFDEDKGDLYEGMINDFRTGMHETFEVKDGAGRKMKSIVRVVKALKRQDDEIIDALGRSVDLDQFINFWALEIISGHWDGYNGNLNNFYVYSGKEDKRLRFIPWGTDGSFAMANPFMGMKTTRTTNAKSILAKTVYTHPNTLKDFHEALAYHLKHTWVEEEVLADLEMIHKMVVPHVIGSTQAMKFKAEEIREYVKSNRTTIEEDLNGPTPEWVVKVEGQKPIIPGSGKGNVNIVGTAKAKFLLEMGTLNFEQDESTDQVKFEITKKDGSKLEIVNYRGQAGFPPAARWFDAPRMVLQGKLKDQSDWLRFFIRFDPEKFRHLNRLKLDHFNAMGWVSLFNDETQQFTICGMLDGEIVIDKIDIDSKPHIEGSINAKLRLWRVPSVFTTEPSDK